MSSYRIFKRAILFGADDEIATRSDFATRDEVEANIRASGTPVPVVFGARYLEPTVVGWQGLANSIKLYAWIDTPNGDTSPGLLNTQGVDYQPGTTISRDDPNIFPSPLVPQNNPALASTSARTGEGITVPMYILSMRMVICAGQVDHITYWEVGGVQASFNREPLPATFENRPDKAADPSLRTVSNWNATRFMVSAADFRLLGDNNGLGISSRSSLNYDIRSQFSEVWLTSGDRENMPTTHVVVDGNATGWGVSSLVFNNFNFGGANPLPPWRLAVSRTDTLTYRDPETKRYRPNWYLPKCRLTLLNREPTQKVYLWVLDRSVSRSNAEDAIRYLLALPHDDNTIYQLVYSAYYVVTSQHLSRGTGVSSSNTIERSIRRFTTRASVVTALENYRVSLSANFHNDRITDGKKTYDGTTRTSSTVNSIAEIYAELIRPFAERKEEVDGVIILMGTDVEGQYQYLSSTTNVNDSRNITGMSRCAEMLKELTFPYSSDQFLTSTTDYQKQLITSNVPEVRCFVFTYFLLGQRRFRFRLPTNRGQGQIVRNFDDADSLRRVLNPSGVVGYNPTPSQFVAEFKIDPFFGYTMNPVHALREALTDPEWGAGIPESMIDDVSFRYAADVCFDEKLDYCYVHSRLGGVNQLITQISDYIDGIVFYDAPTDKVLVKLIRQDFDVNTIPSFDESTICRIVNYKRQHTNEITNSVTVKFRDAVTDSPETVTIHDQDAASRAGGINSLTLNFDGCSTATAAVRIAERELAAVSNSVISFSATIDPDVPLKLGDPIKISYADLGLSNLVMRVSRIDHTDGLTGGIAVSLIQDVFADLSRFSPNLIGSLTDIPDYSSQLFFLEASADDLSRASVNTPFASDQNARYYKVGRKQNENELSIDVNGQDIFVSVGDLLTDLPAIGSGTSIGNTGLISSDPIQVSFVGLSPATAALLTSTISVRIGDEIVEASNGQYDAMTGVWTANVTLRANDDTVAVAHQSGEPVYILNRMVTFTTPWDGFAIPVASSVLVLPDITFITRGRLPYPPLWVTINTQFIPNIRTDGDLAIRIQPRRPVTGDTADQKTVYRLLEGETELTSGELDVLPNVLFNPPVNTVTIPTATIGTGTKSLTLVVGSRLDTRTSWQSWNFTLDWSATTRERVGWTYNFGNNWGHGPATIDPGLPLDGAGWGENWDETWDD